MTNPVRRARVEIRAEVIPFKDLTRGPKDNQFCSLVVHRLGDEGREYLVQEYNSGDGTQIKFPGGMGGPSTDRPGETPMETLRREALDEVYVVIPKENEPRFIVAYTPTPNEDGGFHHKLFFPIEESETTGEIRQIPITDLGGDKLSPPFWRTASELLEPERHGFNRSDAIFKSHQLALKTLDDFLSSR